MRSGWRSGPTFGNRKMSYEGMLARGMDWLDARARSFASRSRAFLNGDAGETTVARLPHGDGRASREGVYRRAHRCRGRGGGCCHARGRRCGAPLLISCGHGNVARTFGATRGSCASPWPLARNSAEREAGSSACAHFTTSVRPLSPSTQIDAAHCFGCRSFGGYVELSHALGVDLERALGPLPAQPTLARHPKEIAGPQRLPRAEVISVERVRAGDR